MSFIQADPDELDRYASSLRSIASTISSEARKARSGVSSLSHFRGKERNRLEQDVAAASRGIENAAKVLEQHAKSLRSFSNQIRNLKR
jgi:uncharacterized protein YukE